MQIMHTLPNMFRMRSVKVILIIFVLFASIALQNNRAMEENSRTINLRDQMNNEKYQNNIDQLDLQNHPDPLKNLYPSINPGSLENHITNWEPRGISPNAVDPAAFVSYWNTSLTSSGSSLSNQIKLPLESSGTYNFSVFWGDGSNNTITTWNDPAVTHTYSTEGVYNITITGTIIGWRFNNGGDRLKLMEIAQWGDLRLGNSGFYFYGSSNLRLTTNDTLDLTGTTSLSFAFFGAKSLSSTGNLNSWDVSKVINMQYMFKDASSFNQPLNSWNVSQVTSMGMEGMFFNASSFNQPLNSWNVSKVTNMAWMFWNASSFNQPLNSWDVSQVTNMFAMFLRASSFNQPLNSWDVSQVTDMTAMFYGASSFNQSLNNWDVSNVKDIWSMFRETSSFNQPLNSWNVSQVTSLREMFYNATSFNQPIGNWDVSKVYDMQYMFEGALSFNQPLGNWDISQVKYMSLMFNQVNLSVANYDNLLTGWSALNLQSGVQFDAGYSKYSSTVGEPARRYIIETFGWSISDGGIYTPRITTTLTSTTTVTTTTTSTVTTTPNTTITISTTTTYTSTNSPTSTSTTSTAPTTNTSSTSTSNPTPLSWISLIALPILGVMMLYKRKIQKN